MSSELVFCSSALPENERFDFWREMTTSGPGAVDVTHADPRPFFGRVEWQPLGPIDLYRASYSAAIYSRSRRLINADGFDGFSFHINLGGCSETIQNGNRTVLDGLSATGHAFSKPFDVSIRPASAHSYYDNLNLVIPRDELLKRSPRADERLLGSFKDQAPFRLLVQYLKLLDSSSSVTTDPSVLELAGNHILDLLALLLGPSRDAEWAAARGGLRASRLASLQNYLQERHHECHLSAVTAASALSISERYVHDLIAESGESFTEAVNRLRLERAKRLLGDPAHRHWRVGEIALAVGFSDLSYFNRLFRRRFGDTPNGFRANRNPLAQAD